MDPTCIKDFVSWLKEVFGGLDVLVNNAAVSFNDINENSVEHAETTIKTNYYGPKLLTESLLPLFRRSDSVSRILNISSRLGLLNKLSNPIIREILEDEERLTEERIDFVVNRFLEDVKSGVWAEEGWPKVWTDYAVSKVGLNAYTRVLAKRYDGHGLSVNCFCPGFTQTSMTRGKGNHSAEAAAEIAADIILLSPDNLPTGKFYINYKAFLYSNL
ncbi:Short-chain dehydrogenase/reductase SDR [Macleaya cordata]|uniref:Short-chain dehydrogenase/reductase SDR n=1 Tax=Macleaya cordata TaxID=56857 RepID=A0A200Q3X8_MACCD|nr:Short-chain dehydrogenase/reductase SDR [Macleaya cordata]